VNVVQSQESHVTSSKPEIGEATGDRIVPATGRGLSVEARKQSSHFGVGEYTW
jgi:hypothetical protein